MKNSFKETYRLVIDIIETWIKNNPGKRERILDCKRKNIEHIDELKNIFYWYDIIKIDKELITGEKTVSIDDIKKHMLKYFENIIFSESDIDEYTKFGYCGGKLYFKIIKFWNNLNDKSILDIISGKYSSDRIDLGKCIDFVDLDGGRDYFLHASNVTPLLFNYVSYTLNWSKEEYKSKIYNSIEITDSILHYFPIDVSILFNNIEIKDCDCEQLTLTEDGEYYICEECDKIYKAILKNG